MREQITFIIGLMSSIDIGSSMQILLSMYYFSTEGAERNRRYT